MVIFENQKILTKLQRRKSKRRIIQKGTKINKKIS